MEKRTKLSKRLLPGIHDLPYKLFYFTFYAGYMPLLLYLPIYLKYLGLSVVDIAILNGIRPILQSIATPVLIMVGEKYHSRKLLLIVSSIVMIGKVLIIFLLLRPKNQVCTTTYISESGETVKNYSQTVDRKLRKREAGREWLLPADWKDLPKFRGYSDEAKKLSQRTDRKLVNDENNMSTNAPNNYLAKFVNNNKKRQFNASTTQSNTTTIRTKAMATKGKLPTKIFTVFNDEDEVYRIFVALMILVVLGDAFDSAIFTLVDHSCVANMNVANYGSIRLWGNLGWGIMTPIIGVIIHRFSHEFCGKMIGSFDYVFFFSIGFAYIALLIGSNLNFDTTPQDSVMRKIHGIQDNFQYGIFLFASAYSGFCNGFLFTFVNWFIDSLGGNALIMGTATACKCAVDFALFFFLEKIIDALGHVATTSIGFIGYILVFLIYFAINQAWLVILAETLHAMVYALMTSTSVAFLIFAAPAGSSPKMQGILQGIYWGFGTGCGAIFGGYCVKEVGFAQTFLAFTIITCIVAFLFLVIQFISYVNSSADQGSEKSSETSSNFGDNEDDTYSEESEYEDSKKFSKEY